MVRVARIRGKSATVDRFGRILIPKSLREAVGLRQGIAVEIRQEGRSIRLVPNSEEAALVEVDGVLIARGGRLPADFDIVAFIKAQREARAKKLAGKLRK